MVNPSLRSVVFVLCSVLSAIWMLLTIAVLVTSITGHSYLYTAPPGGLVLPHLSLLGKVYMGSSLVMPFAGFLALLVA